MASGPAVIEFAPQVGGEVPPAPAPPISPAPQAPDLTGTSRGPAQARPEPASNAAAAKALSDAWKQAEAAPAAPIQSQPPISPEPPATPIAPGAQEPAPGAAPAAPVVSPTQVTVDLSKLPKAVQDKVAAYGGDVTAALEAIARQAPVEQPIGMDIEPPPAAQIAPLDPQIVQNWITNELLKDPQYVLMNNQFVQAQSRLMEIDKTELPQKALEVQKLSNWIENPAIAEDSVKVREYRERRSEIKGEISDLKSERRDEYEKYSEAWKFCTGRFNEMHAEIRRGHSVEQERANEEAWEAAVQERAETTFMKSWDPARDSAAVAAKVPPQMLDHFARLYARDAIDRGVLIEDMPAFMRGVATNVKNFMTTAARVESGTYAVAAQARAAGVSPLPSAIQGVPPSSSQAQPSILSNRAIERNAEQALRAALRGGG